MITRKIRIREFFYYFFSFYFSIIHFQHTLHHPYKPDQNWVRGGRLHILSWEKPHIYIYRYYTCIHIYLHTPASLLFQAAPINRQSPPPRAIGTRGLQENLQSTVGGGRTLLLPGQHWCRCHGAVMFVTIQGGWGRVYVPLYNLAVMVAERRQPRGQLDAWSV